MQDLRVGDIVAANDSAMIIGEVVALDPESSTAVIAWRATVTTERIEDLNWIKL